jgi:hypothetical protein
MLSSRPAFDKGFKKWDIVRVISLISIEAWPAFVLPACMGFMAGLLQLPLLALSRKNCTLSKDEQQDARTVMGIGG